MKKTTYVPMAMFTLTLALVGCGGSTEPANETTTDSSQQSEGGTVAQNAQSDDTSLSPAPTDTANTANTAEWNDSDELNKSPVEEELAEELAGAVSLVEAMDDDSIPYPVYPNGLKYRVGGENGMRIVLYQTEDSFEEVDAYYQAQAGKQSGMPRLIAMNDYVRYSADDNDVDPWETTKPGIVIHKFNNEAEREAVGASEKANTNIIMSFE